MTTIKDCFNIILRGDKEESRLAARRVRKILHRSQAGDGGKYDEIKEIINEAPNVYAGIAETWRQENFVTAVSVIYFLHGKETEPDFLFPWLFQLLQHSNGYVRYAAVKMISHELGGLTVHIRYPGEKSGFNNLSPEQAGKILFALDMNLRGLLAGLWEPKYDRYKYIDSLPPCPYKSVQMVLAEIDDYVNFHNE